MGMIKKVGVKKLYKDTCPNCGERNRQIVETCGTYPEYDEWTDTITKYFVCRKCLTEYYEKYKLEYDGCEVIELVNEDDPSHIHYEQVCYDANGNKIN